MTSKWIFIITAALIFPASKTEAVIIASNLSGANNGNASPQSTFWLAQAFTTDATEYNLDSVTIGGGNSSAGSQIFLYSDSGSLPSSQLASFDTAGFATPISEYTLPVESATTLTANTTYWVVFAPNDFNFGLWTQTTAIGNQSGPGAIPDQQAFSNNGGASFSATNINANLKFEVNGTVVPEPSTMSVLVLGAVFFLRNRRRR